MIAVSVSIHVVICERALVRVETICGDMAKVATHITSPVLRLCAAWARATDGLAGDMCSGHDRIEYLGVLGWQYATRDANCIAKVPYDRACMAAHSQHFFPHLHVHGD